MNDREKLRGYLENLRVLAQQSASCDFMRSVFSLDASYWALQILTELQMGKAVDEILSRLDDIQVVKACLALEGAFRILFYVVMMLFQVMDAVTSIVTQLHQQSCRGPLYRGFPET